MSEIRTNIPTAEPPLRPTTDAYRGGWVDRLLDVPYRLPGPAWTWLVLFGVGIVLLATAALWLSGTSLAEGLEANLILPAAVLVYFLGLASVMAHVGRSAFDEFRPALGAGTGDPDRLRFELTRIPDRQALASVALGIATTFVAFMATGSQDTSDMAPALAAVMWALWWPAIGSMALAVFYTLRQLRWVSRLYALATNIDPFDTVPLNALSRLTATSAIGILIVAILLLGPTDQAAPSDQDAVAFLLGFGPLPLLIPVAVASFVLPLRGMHRRLVMEKGRLLAASNARLKETLALIHQTVDSKDFEHADALQKTLTSLLAERDVLARLATWPWSPGTLRGFATAALLPVVLWLVTRVLERFV